MLVDSTKQKKKRSLFHTHKKNKKKMNETCYSCGVTIEECIFMVDNTCLRCAIKDNEEYYDFDIESDVIDQPPTLYEPLNGIDCF